MLQLVSISKTLQLKKHASVHEFRQRALDHKEGFHALMIGKETVGTKSQKIKLKNDGYTHMLLSVKSEKDIMTISESIPEDLQDE